MADFALAVLAGEAASEAVVDFQEGAMRLWPDVGALRRFAFSWPRGGAWLVDSAPLSAIGHSHSRLWCDRRPADDVEQREGAIAATEILCRLGPCA